MKALIIGATGLVGKQLTNLLLADDRFTEVVVFVRRTFPVQHLKLQQHVINFDAAEEWKHLVKGDVLFSALGTTLKQAGSKEAQFKVDHTYQFEFAKAASENGVPVYALVSAAGVSETSGIFYNRMKAQLEKAVSQLNFKSINIIQPSLLAGERKEERMGEKIGFALLKVINTLGILRKYRPIYDKTVAKALINAAVTAKPGVNVYTLQKVFELAGE